MLTESQIGYIKLLKFTQVNYSHLHLVSLLSWVRPRSVVVSALLLVEDEV